jgi:hypothetical protein
MKLFYMIFIIGLSLAVEASAWNLGDAIKKGTELVTPKKKEPDGGQRPEPQKTPTTSPAATPVNALTKGIPPSFFESVEKHDYEDVMSEDETHCATLVAPFTIKNSSKKVIMSTLKRGGIGMLKAKFTGGIKSDETLLDKAKAKAKEVNWLPMKYEMTYGREIHDSVVKNDRTVIPRSKKGRVKRLYAKADNLLTKILNEVEEDHEYKFEILLIDNNDINATALPGGFLHINTGVLDAPEAELVLAHEIGHVFRRHQTMAAQARLIDTVDSIEEIKFLLKGDNKTYDEIIGRAVGLFSASSVFSRQQELQADACAVRLASRVPALNVSNMISSYTKNISTSFSVQAKKTDGSPEAMSGHPDYPERKTHMTVVFKMSKST